MARRRLVKMNRGGFAHGGPLRYAMRYRRICVLDRKDIAMTLDQRLRPHERLSLKRDFDRVFREGKAFHFREITVRALPNGLEYSRFGMSVGKRYGGAVRRNRIRRVLREAYRLNKPLLVGRFDLVVLPRAAWKEIALAGVTPVFREALRKVSEAFDGG
jgi:ribonuclease P protein component